VLPPSDLHELLIRSVVDYAIFMLDPEGHVVSWNPGAERTKGYAESEIIGQHFSRFYT
jgi:PAS domain S-box-containing protein